MTTASPSVDHTPDIVGRHPFRVEVRFGDHRDRAYVSDAAGHALGPGVQALTPKTARLLAAREGLALADLHAAARAAGTDAPFLLNLAGQADAARYEQRLRDLAGAAGRPPPEPATARVFAALKGAIDEALALGPQAIVKAAMAYLAAPASPGDAPYGTLVRHINQALAPDGRNPRRVAPAAPVGGVQDIAPEGLQLWWVKEGSATIVFQVRVALAGGRPPARFVVNIAKDLTEASTELRETHADFVAHFRADPAAVMEPFGAADVHINTWRGPAAVAAFAAEWVEGHELHVYEGDNRLYVWLEQHMGKDHPVAPGTSDRIWEQVTRMRARLTSRGPEGLLPVATHINAGDYIAVARLDGDWDVLLIWTRRPPPGVAPADFIVLSALLGGVNIFGADPGPTVWWDQPERALAALQEGLAQAGFDAGEIRALLRDALAGVFTAYAEHPRDIPHLPVFATAEPAQLQRVFARARAVLAAAAR